MKKWIAMVLALVLLMQALPWTAFAATGLGGRITEEQLQTALSLAGLQIASDGVSANAVNKGTLYAAAENDGMLELEAKTGEYHDGMEPDDTWDAQMFMDYLENKTTRDLFNVMSVFTRAETMLEKMRTDDPDAYARFTGGDQSRFVEDCHWWVQEADKVQEKARYLNKRLGENVSIIEQNTEYLANSDDGMLFDYEIAQLSNQINAAADEIRELRETTMALIFADMMLIEAGQHIIDGTNEPEQEFSDWLHSVLSCVDGPREASVSADTILFSADTRTSRMAAGGSVLANAEPGDVTVMVINNNQFSIELHGVGNRPVGGVAVTVTDLNGTYTETKHTDEDTGSVVFDANYFVTDEDQEMEISLEVDASAQGYRSFYIPWVLMSRGSVRRETLVLLTGPEDHSQSPTPTPTSTPKSTPHPKSTPTSTPKPTPTPTPKSPYSWPTPTPTRYRPVRLQAAAGNAAAAPYVYSCTFNGYDCVHSDKTVIISELNDSELDFTVEVDNPDGVSFDAPILHYWRYGSINSGKVPVKEEMKPTLTESVRGTTRTKYIYRAKWKQILTPDITSDQKPYFVLPSTGEVIKTKVIPVLSSVSQPLTTGEEANSPLARVMSKGFGYDFYIPVTGDKKIRLSMTLPFDKYLPKVAIDPFGYVTVTMGSSTVDPDNKKEFWKTEETEKYQKQMKQYEHKMDKTSKRQQLGSAMDMYKKMANKKGMGCGNLDFGFFIMLGGKAQYDKDDQKTYWAGKGEVGGSITLGYSYTQVLMAPVIPVPVYLNIGITLSAGAGFGLSFECVTSRDGDMLDHNFDILHDVTLDFRLTVSVTLGIGIKGLLSVWISGTGMLNILLKLAVREPVRFSIYFEALFSVGFEALFISASYVFWQTPRWEIYSYPRDDSSMSANAFSLFTAYAEEAEASEVVEPLYYEPKNYATLAPEAEKVLADVEHAEAGVKLVSAGGFTYMFYLNKRNKYGVGQVSFVDEDGYERDTSAILDQNVAGMSKMNDYAFDVISDGESIILVAFCAKDFNKLGLPVRSPNRQVYGCYAMRLKPDKYGWLWVQGKVFYEWFYYYGPLVNLRLDEMRVDNNNVFAVTGSYQRLDESGNLLGYNRFDMYNSANFSRHIPISFNGICQSEQKPRVGMNTFARYDVAMPRASITARQTFNSGWVSLDRSEEDPENSCLEVWMPEMPSTGDGMILARGDIQSYALVQTKDTVQPKYAQTIFYTQRETTSERSENRLKAIYIAPRVDANRADTQYDVSFTDFDLSIPASDFYTVTLGASQYLYWLTTAPKEKESDPNIWRVCGVYYDAMTGAVSDQIVIAEFTLPDAKWNGKTYRSVPAQIALTNANRGYIIAKPYTEDESERDIAPMTVYSFPVQLKPAPTLRGAAMLETTVLQGSMAAMEFSMLNEGNMGVAKFDMDVVLMENGHEAGTVETLHANLVRPEESTITMNGKTVAEGEKAVYRLKEFTYSPRQSEWMLQSENKTFYLKDGKADRSETSAEDVRRVSTNVVVPGALGAFAGHIKIPSDWEGKYELRLKITGFTTYTNWIAGSQGESRNTLFTARSANGGSTVETGEQELVYRLDESRGKMVLQTTQALFAATASKGTDSGETADLYALELDAPEPIIVNCEVHDIDVSHRLYDDHYGDELLDIVIRNYYSNNDDISLTCAMYLNDSQTPVYISLPYDSSVLAADTTTTITLPVRTLFDPDTTESARFVITPRGISETATVNNEFTIYPSGSRPLTIVQQPRSIAVEVGNSACFTVGVTGGRTPYVYQWQVYVDSTWKDIPGANEATLTLDKVKAEWNGRRTRCIITDADDTMIISDEAVLTVTGQTPWEDPELPDTGDHMNLPLYLTIALMAAVLLILLRRRKRD